MLEPWVVGMLINLCGSVAINLGTNVMKLGHNLREMSAALEKDRRSIRTFKEWRIGVFIFICGNIANFLSFGFAAQSTLASLGTVQFVSNVLFARLVLKEKITWQVVVATANIVCGCVLLVIFGSHESQPLTVQQMLHLFHRRVYVIYMLCLTVSIVVLYLMYKRGDVHSRSKLKNWVPACYAGFSAMVGSQSVLLAKMLSGMVRLIFEGEIDSFASWFPYVIFAAFVVLAAFWATRLNKSLRMFDAMVIIPLMQINWTLFSIVSGGMYFREFETFSKLQVGLFVLGVFIVFSGVFLLSWKPALKDSKSFKFTRLRTWERRTPSQDMAEAELVSCMEGVHSTMELAEDMAKQKPALAMQWAVEGGEGHLPSYPPTLERPPSPGKLGGPARWSKDAEESKDAPAASPEAGAGDERAPGTPPQAGTGPHPPPRVSNDAAPSPAPADPSAAGKLREWEPRAPGDLLGLHALDVEIDIDGVGPGPGADCTSLLGDIGYVDSTATTTADEGWGASGGGLAVKTRVEGGGKGGAGEVGEYSNGSVESGSWGGRKERQASQTGAAGTGSAGGRAGDEEAPGPEETEALEQEQRRKCGSSWTQNLKEDFGIEFGMAAREAAKVLGLVDWADGNITATASHGSLSVQDPTLVSMFGMVASPPPLGLYQNVHSLGEAQGRCPRDVDMDDRMDRIKSWPPPRGPSMLGEAREGASPPASQARPSSPHSPGLLVRSQATFGRSKGLSISSDSSDLLAPTPVADDRGPEFWSAYGEMRTQRAASSPAAPTTPSGGGAEGEGAPPTPRGGGHLRKGSAEELSRKGSAEDITPLGERAPPKAEPAAAGLGGGDGGGSEGGEPGAGGGSGESAPAGGDGDGAVRHAHVGSRGTGAVVGEEETSPASEGGAARACDASDIA